MVTVLFLWQQINFNLLPYVQHSDCSRAPLTPWGFLAADAADAGARGLDDSDVEACPPYHDTRASAGPALGRGGRSRRSTT